MSKKEISLFSTDKKVPAFLAEAGAKGGNDGVGIDDMAIPQLKILQPLSPELMMNVEGAKAGMFLNSVTHDVFDELFVVNLKYDHNFAIFKTRESGGGKVSETRTKQEATEMINSLPGSPTDYQIADTGVHSLLALHPDGKPYSPMVMYCSGTKKMVSQRWNTQIQLKCEELAIPRYALVWTLSITQEKNSKGSWYGFTMDFAGAIQDEELFKKAESMRETLEEQSDWQPKLEAAQS